MSRVVGISIDSVVPERSALVRAMGGTEEQASGERTQRLLGEAIDEFRRLAAPVGLLQEIAATEFARVYQGEGDNDEPSPLLEIFPRAEALALFALTVGEPVSRRITELFDSGQSALAVTLDSAASVGAELAGAYLDGLVLGEAREAGLADESTRVLRYSPGYCGWNITGQRALFAALGPGDIGITLTESCLMEPLKSISGVAVTGPAGIHEFVNDYGFCGECRTKDCRHRIENLTRTERRREQ